jgi:hypothetical protein
MSANSVSHRRAPLETGSGQIIDLGSSGLRRSTVPDLFRERQADFTRGLLQGAQNLPFHGGQFRLYVRVRGRRQYTGGAALWSIAG